ncbi:MAG: M48 family metallopeptidase [Candidatus Acidiferrum sp.]
MKVVTRDAMLRIPLLLTMCCIVAGPVDALATPAVDTSSAQKSSPQQASSSTQPVPPIASPRQESEEYTLSPERYQKAVAYSRARYILYFISTFVGLLALVLILQFGVAAKYRDVAQSVSRRRWLQGLIFIPLLFLTLDLCDLPISAYGHMLSLRYEQSVQHWGSWLWDWTKAEILGTALAVLLGLILFAVIRKSPRRWWFYFWLAAVPIAVVLTFISPLVFDPLFNKFEPLSKTSPTLVSKIEALTGHAGAFIPTERIFLMRASEKTNAINAYVTGLSASKRVVIYDTTLQKTTTDETLFIVGHELGHYVLGHVTQGFLVFLLGLFLGLYAVFRGLHWTLRRWGAGWKMNGVEDWASLAVLLLGVQVLTFFATPLQSGYSRSQEHAADIFALEAIHYIVPNPSEVAAHSFQVLGEVDLADPNPPPFIAFWLYSHPPLAERLRFARSYDPWSKGESPRYVK